MQNKNEIPNALCREHLIYFMWEAYKQLNPDNDLKKNWHSEVLCRELEETLKKPGRALLVTCPPRYGKSFVMSVCFIAWTMGHNPKLKFLVASYSEELAEEPAATYKKLVETDWYKCLFPGMRIDPKRQRALDLHTTKGGRRKAISRGGAATGFGADIIVIDDIIKAADANSPLERLKSREYFEQTLLSRLNDKKNGLIIANQQRFHQDDPAAALLEKGFDHICLRAIAEEDEEWQLYHDRIYRRQHGEALFPELEDLETLESIKQKISPAVFSAQYQQEPVNPGGNRISWDLMRFYDTDNTPYQRHDYLAIIQSWDTASSTAPGSDYSVCTTIGQHKTGVWHVLDVNRSRLSYDRLKERASFLIRKYRPDRVTIEAASSGYALIADLRKEFSSDRFRHGQVSIVSQTQTVSKEERVFVRQHKLQDGTILLPRQADWLPDLRSELIAFPAGNHDDQVDSLFQAIEYIDSARGQALMTRDPVTHRPRSAHRRVRR